MFVIYMNLGGIEFSCSYRIITQSRFDNTANRNFSPSINNTVFLVAIKSHYKVKPRRAKKRGRGVSNYIVNQCLIYFKHMYRLTTWAPLLLLVWLGIR